ncbi:MAG TPA: BNR-4 repeat-containing protein [Phycisphaerae bacterium]|nr:BNR-4 repeat-containing protein [Phycisphaerae bacterium]
MNSKKTNPRQLNLRALRHSYKVLCLELCVLSFTLAAPHAFAANNVTFSSVASNAYYTGDANSCAIDLNNIITYGGYQFLAYYNTSSQVMIARRAAGDSSWTTVNSGFTGSPSDDHDIIALAVDSTGTMHMSWDMHNIPLEYATSNASVLSSDFSSTSFTQRTSTNAPSLFPSAGATTNEVTYPTFYHIPGSNNLLFAYRNGGAGGGSGNGNEYMNIYNPTTGTWSQSFVINGEKTSVNAYLNNLVYTSTGNLLMSWTWRATSNWQTNSNIMFAQSPDNGATWYKQGGTTQYTLPIIQSGTPSTSVGQIIKSIPQNSSFINQTSMAVDGTNRPMIASYWVPNNTIGDPNINYPTGYLQRQYMLAYYTGTKWDTSQVSNRTTDTAIDTSGADVRDLGRPIVLVDSANRILLVTRSENTSMGATANPATPNNDIVVYYTTDSQTGGATLPDQLHWNSFTLDSANMGIWEPTYDSAAWAASSELDLFYEPSGLTGQTSGNVSVLSWNEAAFFTQTWNNASGGGDGVTWDTNTNSNWANGAGASKFHIADTVLFNDSNNNNYNVTINSTVRPGSITVNNSAGNYIFSGTGGIAGTGSLTKSGTGYLTLNTANSFSGGTIVNAGALIVANPGALGTGALTIHSGATVALQSGLSSAVLLPAVQLDGSTNAWLGSLDLAGNKLVVENSLTHAAAFATLQNQVYYGITHTSGIFSTALPSNTALAVIDNRALATPFSTFGGIAVDANSILVAPELLGDTNADGHVDLTDLSTVLNNFGQSTTAWTSGNFDNQPTIDLTDLSAVLNNFGMTYASAHAVAAAQIIPTPEPATLALLAPLVWCSAFRRPRRSESCS